MRRGGDAEAGPAARRTAPHTHTHARARSHTHTRARGSRGAPPSCAAAISPPARARPLADSPFSSNKDINPTLLARDWDEVRRANPSPRSGGGGSSASSGRARRRRAAGRGCPSDVRGPHPSAPGAWRPGAERRRSELRATGRLPRQPAARGGRGGGEDGGGESERRKPGRGAGGGRRRRVEPQEAERAGKNATDAACRPMTSELGRTASQWAVRLGAGGGRWGRG